eukprot:4679663-Amphidinium_carterae.1
MPRSGSAPAKRLVRMKNLSTSLKLLSGSIPTKLFFEISKWMTDSIARIAPSGSAPAKWFKD